MQSIRNKKSPTMRGALKVIQLHHLFNYNRVFQVILKRKGDIKWLKSITH